MRQGSVRSGLSVTALLIGMAMLAACEAMVDLIQDNPKVVRTLSKHEVMIVYRQF